MFYVRKTYSIEGEDALLYAFYESRSNKSEGRFKGFYIDTGAHQPKRFSNTLGKDKKTCID